MTARFKLEPVRKHRRILEDQARQRLAEVQTSYAAHQQETAQRQTALEHIQNELRRQQSSGINAVELLLYDQSLQRHRRQLEESRRRAEELEQAIAQRFEALAEACRNRRLLEKLKEKQRQAWRQKLQRLERNQLDETALIQFMREK